MTEGGELEKMQQKNLFKNALKVFNEKNSAIRYQIFVRKYDEWVGRVVYFILLSDWKELVMCSLLLSMD